MSMFIYIKHFFLVRLPASLNIYYFQFLCLGLVGVSFRVIFVIFSKAIKSVYDFLCLLITKKIKSTAKFPQWYKLVAIGLSFVASDSSPLSSVISQCGSETCAAWLVFCWRHNARYTHQQRYAADISQIFTGHMTQTIWLARWVSTWLVRAGEQRPGPLCL